jgi:UMF1 family MFS transporter
MAYAAALLLLLLSAGAMIGLGLESVDRWRPFFMFSGLWFFAFAIPTMLWLREPQSTPHLETGRNMFTEGFTRLRESIRNTRHHRDLAILLAASLFYGTGMSVVFFFASKLAEEFGFTQVDLVIFIAVLTISGIVGTILPTFWQDKIGHRRSMLLLLTLWLGTALGFAWYAHLHELHDATGPHTPFPTWPLWLIGNLLGFGLGSLGSASRAFVGFFAPPDREAETFGMWGLMMKLAAIMTFPFAWVKDTIGTSAALLVLAGFLATGLILTLFIDEKRGLTARGG